MTTLILRIAEREDEFELPSGRPVILGRRVESPGIRLDDPTVAGWHARVFESELGWCVEDLGIPPGVYVNQRITHGAQVIRPGDVIRLGVVQLKVERVDGPLDPSPAQQPEFVLRCAQFSSPYKAALADSPQFTASARRFAEETIRARLPRRRELVEFKIGSKHDRPSSPELERLTRDFFHFDIRAFGAEWGAHMCAEVRFDPGTERFVLQSRRYNLDVDDLSVPNEEFVAWFVDGRRCPGCGVFPDVSDEYTGCNLCDYADHQLETIEEARQRFADSAAADLVPAIHALMRAVREEQRPGRLACLRQRLYEVLDTPAKVHEPLPWTESLDRTSR